MRYHNRIKPTTPLRLSALLAGLALGLGAVGSYAQIIVTPDQFTISSGNGNITLSTAGTPYSGDNVAGYYQTLNMGNSPSALINVPLTGLAPGWNLYTISEWNPVATSQYHVVNIINNGIGYGVSSVPGEPWAGEFGTQQQYLQVNGGSAPGWAQLGPGPQSDSSLGGGTEVWINGSGAPSFLQVHYLGFENSLETFDAFMVSEVPEPSILGLGVMGGLALLAGLRRGRS